MVFLGVSVCQHHGKGSLILSFKREDATRGACKATWIHCFSHSGGGAQMATLGLRTSQKQRCFIYKIKCHAPLDRQQQPTHNAARLGFYIISPCRQEASCQLILALLLGSMCSIFHRLSDAWINPCEIMLLDQFCCRTQWAKVRVRPNILASQLSDISFSSSRVKGSPLLKSRVFLCYTQLWENLKQLMSASWTTKEYYNIYPISSTDNFLMTLLPVLEIFSIKSFYTPDYSSFWDSFWYYVKYPRLLCWVRSTLYAGCFASAEGIFIIFKSSRRELFSL